MEGRAQDASSAVVIRHGDEPHDEGASRRTNWLRAAVLGANDGIVSVAALLVGVAGATQDRGLLLLAGLSGVVAGALSMGVGEYVSVSTQRDSEHALLEREREELARDPQGELAELADIYRQRGLSADLARDVAEQLSAHDALRSHAEAELTIDPDSLVSPVPAAAASTLSFALGALLPLLATALAPASVRIAITATAVLLALTLTGCISARLGGAAEGRAVLRVGGGGALALAITYMVGRLVGTTL
jgi:VIT1/CCC1 family predicted Fe2+/Mn2+ transporter